MSRPTAADVVAGLLDPGSFVSWDQPVDLDHSAYSSADYLAEVALARDRAGTDEAVVTGRGEVGGRPVAVIVSEFGFLAGSIGAATADRISDAIRRATAEGLPLVAAPCSGGTRMQEGTPAFVRMVDIARAVVAHKRARLPYLVYLRHPTTGGVLASWGSTGHVTFAEPGATVGFLGPRVVESLTGSALPAHVQTSEHLAACGVIDGVLSLEQMRDTVHDVLAVWAPVGAEVTVVQPSPLGDRRSPDAWDAVLSTRRERRPGARDLLTAAGAHTVELGGTGRGEATPAVFVAMTLWGGRPCVVVGQDRAAQSDGHVLSPAALRVAQRGIALADELGLPLVTLIDTPGAELSQRAEETAMAGEIARTITALESVTVPRISVLLGQGCGGGALAMLPADRVVAAGNAWLSPLPPEGASVIVHRDDARAPEMARRQRIRAVDLADEGVVDQIVPEEQLSAPAFVTALAEACARQLDLLGHARGLHDTRRRTLVVASRTAGKGVRATAAFAL